MVISSDEMCVPDQGGGDITEMENSYYRFLLRFISVYTDITVFITDSTGLFLRILLTLD